MNLLFHTTRSAAPPSQQRKRDLGLQRRAITPEFRRATPLLGADPDEKWRACVEENLYGANTLDYTVQPLSRKQAPRGRCERT